MAAYEEITIKQGSDIAVEIHCETNDGAPVDFTNYMAAAKMKRTYNSDSADTTDFTAFIANPGTDGVVTIALTSEETAALKPGWYFYDVETQYFLDSSGDTVSIERVLEGKIFVTPAVTK